jgi:hypothetical protein
MQPDDETPGQSMKRIEAEVRGTANAQRTSEGYSANIGAQRGPLSAMVMSSGDPESGAPQAYGVRGALGPISFTHMQPSAPVAPIRKIGVNVPFDADAYFGVNAAQTPSGRQYGVELGRGDLNAYGSYNPTRRDLNAGFQFERRFNNGGPVRMEEGGPYEAPPLTIFRKSPPKEAPVGDVEKRGAVDNVPAPEAYNRKFAETVREIPQGIVDYFAEKSAQGDPSQRIADDINFAGSAIAGIPSSIAGYFSKKSEESDPSQKIAEDIQNLGGAFKQAFMENPVGMALDIMNLPGAVTSLRDASDAKKEYDEAVAEGDEKKAASAKNRYAMALPGILPVVGGAMKVASKSAKLADVAKAAEEASLVGKTAEEAGVAEKFAGKAGTSVEEMGGLLDKVRGTELGKMVERYQDLPAQEAHKMLFDDLKSLATEGEVGKEWYERSSQRILDFVGGDKDAADKFAQLIAIYSPQTAVDVNTQNAMKAYNRALTGEALWDGKIIDKDVSFPTIKAANDYVKSLGGAKEGFTKIPLDDSGKRFLIAQHGDKNAYENIATLDRDLKAHLVMNEGVPFEGRKINNFYNNLMVQIDPARLQGSTQDLWMARAFGFLDDAVGGGAKYDYMERLTADLAEQLGWKPHQVQAAIWTAMKTRQEGVKSAVKAEAIARGMADMVPDPKNKGKMIFEVREGEEKAYGQLLREKSLGAEITPEAIAAAARDFSDFLDQNLAHVSWESAPSTKVGHLDGFDALAPEAKAEYHVGIQKALQNDEGQDLLARYLNILSPGAVDAPGYWEGASNPATLTQVGSTRIKGAKQAPDIDTASKQVMEVYASALGLLLKQDGVGYHRPYYNPQISKANGVQYRFENPLSADDVITIGKALDEKFGGSVALIPAGDNEIRVLNFGDTKNQKDFHKALQQTIGGLDIENTARTREFASDGNLVSNNWKEQPNGEDYIRGLSAAGRSDVLEFISTVLAPRVEAFDKQFADKYGLKRNEALEAQIRNAKGVADGKAEGGQVKFAKGGAVEDISKLVTETAVRAHDVPPKQLAYLIRAASGMNVPADRADEFARQIIRRDTDGLAARFKKYSNAKRTLMRLNAMLGGRGNNGFAQGGLFQADGGLRTAKEHAQQMLAANVGHPTVQQSLKNLIGFVK